MFWSNLFAAVSILLTMMGVFLLAYTGNYSIEASLLSLAVAFSFASHIATDMVK